MESSDSILESFLSTQRMDPRIGCLDDITELNLQGEASESEDYAITGSIPSQIGKLIQLEGLILGEDV